jgi:hypothetical protein
MFTNSRQRKIRAAVYVEIVTRMIFVFCCESNIDRSKEQVSPWLPITRNELLAHRQTRWGLQFPMPLRELVPKFGTVCPVGQEKKRWFFRYPCRRQDWNFFKNCQLGLGQERPNKCQGAKWSNGIFVIQGETCSRQDRTDAKWKI